MVSMGAAAAACCCCCVKALGLPGFCSTEGPKLSASVGLAGGMTPGADEELGVTVAAASSLLASFSRFLLTLF